MTIPIRTCSRCGCTADNLIEFHDRLLCPDCLEEFRYDHPHSYLLTLRLYRG